jgi:hypothetical protein
MGSSEKAEGEDKENVYDANEDEEMESDELDGAANAEEEEEEEASATDEDSSSSANNNSNPSSTVGRGRPTVAANSRTEMTTRMMSTTTTTLSSSSTPTANGEMEMGSIIKEDDDSPLDIGEHYLVRRSDDQWCEYL